MAALPTMRPLGCLRSFLRTQEAIQPNLNRRWISTIYSKRPERVPLPPNIPEQFLSQIPKRLQPENGKFVCNYHSSIDEIVSYLMSPQLLSR